MDEPVVEPNATAPAPAPTVEPAPGAEPAPAPESKSSLPKELLQIPALMAVFAGQPAAVSAPIAEFAKVPEAKLIIDNKDLLLKAGMGLYRSLDNVTGVLFNQLHMHPEELKAADQAGQLLQVAPSFDSVNASVAKSGAAHPVLNAKVPPGFKSAPMPQPPQMASANVDSNPVKPPSAASQKKLMTARVMNLNPGAPTSGPAPGQGRLLNSVLKPVI